MKMNLDIQKMERQLDKDLRENLAAWLGLFIGRLCDSECPHCNRPLNLPGEEQIENWFKGEK